MNVTPGDGTSPRAASRATPCDNLASVGKIANHALFRVAPLLVTATATGRPWNFASPAMMACRLRRRVAVQLHKSVNRYCTNPASTAAV